MRHVISFIVVFLATAIFGWVGLIIGALIAFGVSMIYGNTVQVDHSQPFFSATSAASIDDVRFFELFGFLCKVDGIVSRDEIRGVEIVFRHLAFTDDQRAAAIAGFNRGKRPDFDFEEALSSVRQLKIPPQVAVELVHLMNVVVANADGSGLVAEERALLYRIGEAFGLNHVATTSVLSFNQTNTDNQQQQEAFAQDTRSTLERAYETLGITNKTTTKEMSRTYRKLRAKSHPDKLPRNVSDAERTATEQRFTDIQRAWDVVRVHHGI
ncbi:MAG: DnaJ domain-containing protein [Gammaproteobacteria bacterium]|nr:DnaJ domain-containing protein [Gammaproteobacteria bacterium]